MKNIKRILSLGLSTLSILSAASIFTQKINASAGGEEYDYYKSFKPSNVVHVEHKSDELEQEYLESLPYSWVKIENLDNGMVGLFEFEGKLYADFWGMHIQSEDGYLYIIDGSNMILLNLYDRTFKVEKGYKYNELTSFEVGGFVFSKVE